MGNWITVEGRIEISLEKIMPMFRLQRDMNRFDIWKLQAEVEGTHCEYTPQIFFDVNMSKFIVNFKFSADIKNSWSYKKAKKYIIKYVRDYINYYITVYEGLDIDEEADIVICFVNNGVKDTTYINNI